MIFFFLVLKEVRCEVNKVTERTDRKWMVVLLVDLKDNKVFVKLVGACGCCPHAQMTLKMGVEQILKEEFSDLEEVVAVD